MATIQIKDGKNLQFFLKPEIISVREEFLTKLADRAESEIKSLTKSSTLKKVETNSAVVVILSSEQDVAEDKVVLNKVAKSMGTFLENYNA
jgi:hypothetical protein